MSDKNERLIRRVTRITRRRPTPPRELAFDVNTNLLTWTAPRESGLATHYFIRLTQDSGPPDYQVAIEQTSLQLTGNITKAYISAYNDLSGMESVIVPLTFSPSGGEDPGEGPPLENVTLGTVQLRDVEGEVEVSIPYTPPSGWTGDRLHVYLMAPDTQGSKAVVGMFVVAETSTATPATSRLRGGDAPEPIVTHLHDTGDERLTFRHPFPSETQHWRAIVVSATETKTNSLEESPSVRFLVDPAALNERPSGAEYCPNARNLTGEWYQDDSVSPPVWYFSLAWQNPTENPRWGNVYSWDIFLFNPALADDPATDWDERLGMLTSIGPNDTEFRSTAQPQAMPTIPTEYVVWLIPKDHDGNLNTPIRGVVASIRFYVNREGDAAPADRYTAGRVYNPQVTVLYPQNADGIDMYGFAINASPADPKVFPEWGGCKVVARDIADEDANTRDHPLGELTVDRMSLITATWPAPPTITFDIYFVSMTRDGKVNELVEDDTYSIRVTVVASPTGNINLYRSANYENEEFEVIDGEFRLKNVDFSKAKPGTFSPQFDLIWNETAGTNRLSLVAIDADILRTGVLEIGKYVVGHQSRISQLKIFKTTGAFDQLVAWFGDDTPNPAGLGSGFVGGWIERLAIGGTMASPKIYMDGLGNAYFNGTILTGEIRAAVSFLGTVNADKINSGILNGCYLNLLPTQFAAPAVHMERNELGGQTYWVDVNSAFFIPGFSGGVSFTGIRISRYNVGVGLNHYSTLINRGLVLFNTFNAKVASLVSFNGDSTGTDYASPFWGSLTLHNSLGTETVNASGMNGEVKAMLFSDYAHPGVMFPLKIFVATTLGGAATQQLTISGGIVSYQWP